MALTYNNINNIAGNQDLLLQMTFAVVKQAYSRIGAATGAELALCQAILKAPTAYAPRFLQEALLANAASLATTDGTTLSPKPADSVFDGAVTAQWANQILVGA